MAKINNLLIFMMLFALIRSQTDASTSNSSTSDCLNCTNSKNSNGSLVIDSINCTDCYNCSNVVNCFKCTNVHNSSNVNNSENVWNSSFIYNSKSIINSKNVTDSDSCTDCLNCYMCISCVDCAGYYCQNDENCRNSRWLFDWNEPDAKDEAAWKCSNPVINDWYFNKAGYKKPTYLTDAQTNENDLAFCQQFNGNRSCCNKQTTEEISKIFADYKATLQMRAGQKIENLKKVFEQYHNLDLEKFPAEKLNIQQGIVEEMRQIKITIYNIAKNMATCGRTILNYVSGMMCLGCLPDWRWEKYLLINDPNKSIPKEDFNPEAALNFTIDLNKDPLQTSVFIGRQICEDVFSACKPIMENFNQFSNDSALAVGGFADEITFNQWNFNGFNSSYKKSIRQQTEYDVRNLTKRNVSWIIPAGSEAGVDTKTVPSYTPTNDQIAMGNFKSSLRSLGSEYPYDPVVYYNFNPSINFEDPVIMNSQMCQLITQSSLCVFCSGTEKNSSCDSIDNIYYQIETETDRQYRDFSAYFFQVKVVYLTYQNESSTIVRQILFPPFREAEIFIELQDKSWEYRKNYFSVLENNIINQYKTFITVRDSQDEFRIWNDEYWMNFIYSPALTQGNTFFSQLKNNFESLNNYNFVCELNGTCSLCNQSKCFSQTGYQPYCEDCHFSNVKIEANCENNGCITCLYIGGGVLPYNDTDEEDDNDEPMDKCYIRANSPFYNPQETDYYAPFYRESDVENYGIMEKLFDFNNEADIPWNIAQIGQWFYKIPGSEYFSVVNVMPVDKSIIIPNTTNCTHYDYLLPCDINNPINQCKKWMCNFLIDGFFPNPKLVYDPQNKNDTEFESLFSNSDVFDYKMYQDNQNKVYQGWNLSYGSPDPSKNNTYYDVAYWGPDTTSSSNLQMEVGGINENTDIIRFVNEDEKDIFSPYLKVYINIISLFIGIILVMAH